MADITLAKIINDGNVVTVDGANHLIQHPQDFLKLIKSAPDLALSYANYFDNQAVSALVTNAHKNEFKILSKIAAIPTVFDSNTQAPIQSAISATDKLKPISKLTEAPGRTFTLKDQIIRDTMSVEITLKSHRSEGEGWNITVTFKGNPSYSSRVAGVLRANNMGSMVPVQIYIEKKYYHLLPEGRFDAISDFYNKYLKLERHAELAATSIEILNLLLAKMDRPDPSAELQIKHTGFSSYFISDAPNIFQSTLGNYQLANLQLLVQKSDPVVVLNELLKRDSEGKNIFSQLVDKLPNLESAQVLQACANKLAAIDEDKNLADKRAIVASMSNEVLKTLAEKNIGLAWQFLNAAGKQMQHLHPGFYADVFHKKPTPTAPPPADADSKIDDGAGSSSSHAAQATAPPPADEVVAKPENEEEDDNPAAAPAPAVEPEDAQKAPALAAEPEDAEKAAEQSSSIVMNGLYAVAEIGYELFRSITYPLMEPPVKQEPPAYVPPATNPAATNPAATAPPAEEDDADNTPKPPAIAPALTTATAARYTNMYPDLTQAPSGSPSQAKAAVATAQAATAQAATESEAQKNKKEKKKKVAVFG